MSISLRIPTKDPRAQALVTDASDELVVLAAPCARVGHLMAAWLIYQAALRPGTYLLAAAHPHAHRARVSQWLDAAGTEHSRAASTIELGASRIAFADVSDLDGSPYLAYSAAVLLDCDATEADPRPWVAQHVRGAVRLCGSPVGHGHWFGRCVGDAEAASRLRSMSAQDAVTAGLCPEVEVERTKAVIPAAAFRVRYELLPPQAVERAPFTVFCRKRLKIRDKLGVVVDFALNGRQVSYLALRRAHARRLKKLGLPLKFLTLKYRRGGITTCHQAEAYELTSQVPNTQAVTLAHTQAATQQIFRIARLMHERDPKAPRLKGVGNAQRLEFDDLNSQFFIGTAGSSGFGRGDTLQLVHGSEVSKWATGPRAHERVRDLVAGLTEAASHGEVTLETTANGSEWFAATYREARAKSNDWTPLFLPWFTDDDNVQRVGTFSEDEVRETLTDEELDLVARHGLSMGQVAWRRNKIKALGVLFKQEYPEDDESCFLTSGLLWFDSGRVGDLFATVEENVVTELPGGYVCRFRAPEPGAEYVAGGDTSEGIMNAVGEGGDANGIGIIRRDTGEQVAWLHGWFSPKELAQHSAALCAEYNDALLAMERNNHGHAVIMALEEIGYSAPQRQMYYSPDDGKPGWNTTAVSRPIMLDGLRQAVNDDLMKVNDRHFVREMPAFRRQRDGNYRANSPDRDDTIIKWAIAWQMLKVPVGGGGVGWVRG